MKLLKSLLVVASLIAVFGCARNNLVVSNDLQETFLQLISIDDTNNSMRVIVFDGEETQPQFGSEVEILVQNVSAEKTIYFIPEESTAIRIFVNNNNHWVEIQNGDRYVGGGGVLTPKGQLESDWKTGVRPVLEPNLGEIDKPTIVRILVTGEFMTDGKKTGVPVAAYVDLIMKP